MSQSRNHPFNVEAIEVLTDDFLQRVKEGWYRDPPLAGEFLNAPFVLCSVTDHLKHIFAVYKRVSLPNTLENRQRETNRLERASRSVRKGLVCACFLLANSSHKHATAFFFSAVCSSR
jgi:hypothetical protein